MITRTTDGVLAEVFREHHGRVMAALVASCGGDFDLAEEAFGDAVAEACAAWDERGLPGNPAGWLVTVARRRAIDRIRRDAAWRRRLPALAGDGAAHADPAACLVVRLFKF